MERKRQPAFFRKLPNSSEKLPKTAHKGAFDDVMPDWKSNLADERDSDFERF